MTEEKAKTTTVTGMVTSANERGVRLDGAETWHNLSKYGTDGVVMPAKGAYVTLTLDAKGFVKRVEAAVAPEGASVELPASGAPAGSYALRDRTVCREWAVNAAVNILGGGPGHPVDLGDALRVAVELSARVLGDLPWEHDDKRVDALRKAVEGPGAPKVAQGPSRPPAAVLGGSAPIAAPASASPVPVMDAKPAVTAMPKIVAEASDSQPATVEDLRHLAKLRARAGVSAELVAGLAQHWFAVTEAHKMTRGQARTLGAWLSNRAGPPEDTEV